jgi:transcriptional regulator of acetoin/glycerol metabolism
VNGRVNLEQALPGITANKASDIRPDEIDNGRILSDTQMKELEKANIIKALDKTNWKISGKDGAAAILGIPTSTLNSKIKSLGINRPE